MEEKLKRRRAHWEILIVKYTEMVQQCQQKQVKAQQEVNEWLTKLFAAKERLAEVKELLGVPEESSPDIDELEDPLEGELGAERQTQEKKKTKTKKR